jgi:hypothetical protein
MALRGSLVGQHHTLDVGGPLPAQILKLTVNLTIDAIINGLPGSTYIVQIVQSAAGSLTVTWPANVKWPAGSAPTITATAGKSDLIELFFDGLVYYGLAKAQNF